MINFEIIDYLLSAERVGVRRKLVYLRRIAWASKKVIKNKEAEILEKYCGIKKERPLVVDPNAGKINLKYDPKDVDQDYYL